MIPIISVVGKTNSGKTTLIEKIVPELKKRGYKVGVIKHDVHEFQIDYEGKDTWRMTKAGADNVVIASDKKLAMICSTFDIQHSSNLDDLVNWLFPNVDIVITEGYKRQNKPKIEVTRTGELLCNKDDNLIAVVFNVQQPINHQLLIADLCVPYFDINDPQKIVDFIEEKIF